MQATNHFESVRPTVRRERQERGWGAAFLAGLPHLLMGLLICWGNFFAGSDAKSVQMISTLLGISLAGLVVFMIVRAAREDWPLWSASWYGYAAWIALAIVILLTNSIQYERMWVINLALLVGWLGAVLLGYLYLFAADRVQSLLAVVFLFPLFGLYFLEFIPNPIEGLLAIGTGSLTAVTAALIHRSGDYRRGLFYSLLLTLVLGVSFAYVGVYQANELPEFIPFDPQFSDFTSMLGLYLAIGAVIYGLPPLVEWIWGFFPKKIKTA